MPFQPELITAEYIQRAIAEIDQSGDRVRPGTLYELRFAGKSYPPKEVLRRAHRFANREYLWKRSGGVPTNCRS